MPLFPHPPLQGRSWQSKEAAMKLLQQLAEVAPQQVAAALPDIVPKGSDCLIDPREQVI